MTVAVPFRGDPPAAERMLASLARLRLRPGDRVRVADNCDRPTVPAPSIPGVEVLRAGRERSSYHARNVAAAGAHGDWLLFCDADCAPDPGILDAYFEHPVGAAVGALAGAIEPDPGQRRLAARYARSRGMIGDRGALSGPGGIGAAGGNLLVRRAAFEAVGGFAEGIRSGGDVELCLRLGAAGWELERRARARVVHPHHETVRRLLAQVARYGEGAAWIDRRHPGSAPRWPLAAGLAGSARDIAGGARRGRLGEAAFRAIDAAGLIAHNAGYLGSNRARPIAPGPAADVGGALSAGAGGPRRARRARSAPGSRSG